MTARTMRPFNTFLKLMQNENSAMGILAARLFANPQMPPRVYYKPRVQALLCEQGANDEELALLDKMWGLYVAGEQKRNEAKRIEAAD